MKAKRRVGFSDQLHFAKHLAMCRIVNDITLFCCTKIENFH